ncbi:MAG: glycosyltransferase [Burkholderiales bacterium 35-55-47]|jgi:glycosyltransferase involved in cell wall biosynthesis|uniref:glycosyltransferase n=1 Tax=Limnohabitans sp. TaxID=1907725 RepID=UPI000BCD9DD0|nr:glycosyltransferase [Limnohabitans sp.]OYY18048.1 MAG: glycosyltransferase [Burkholderiales bacterium 35-55-47]OYZ73413.1 MAG: glycosyltransferase [Burkholderiales bacterium 24-55-52]OZB00559.1 MAG: glycosyltransferase [Burkholderiales bacterium 39-55-53]HQR85701.1 glycosyltransferase [Limnohabitans sp.]HQS26382.1 glycosyltransferase [Limnohabitans sp.]
MSQASISGFTFIRNGVELGFPFEASIRSLLPLVDEFVVVVGKSNDDTLARIHAIGSPKIRVIETIWNERMADRGFVYAQQKMMAQFACTGDWAFYLEGDEVVHEAELANIRASVDKHHNNPAVEAFVFDYFHFYGTPDYVANSPAWYRRECRLIRNTIRSYAPDGQYWLITADHKKGRNPQAALANAHIYHYGWVRSNEAMQKKLDQVSKFWSHGSPTIRYSEFDAQVLQPFTGTHPELVKPWLESSAEKSFTIDPNYKLTKREKRHRWLMKLEKAFGLDFSRKHFKLVA